MPGPQPLKMLRDRNQGLPEDAPSKDIDLQPALLHSGYSLWAARFESSKNEYALSCIAKLRKGAGAA